MKTVQYQYNKVWLFKDHSIFRLVHYQDLSIFSLVHYQDHSIFSLVHY